MKMAVAAFAIRQPPLPLLCLGVRREVILIKATPIRRRLANCSSLRERHVSRSTARGSPARAALAHQQTSHGGFCQDSHGLSLRVAPLG